MVSPLLNRQLPPAVHPVTQLVQLEPEEHLLGYNTKAYVLRSSDQPVIRLDLVFPAGHWQQPEFGVAYHTAKLLSEGTQSYSSKAFAEKISYFGASLQADASSDRATITLLCLAKYFNELIKLVQEMWQKPLFPENELAQLKERTIQQVKVERKKNTYLVNEALNVSLFGSHHPYRGSLKTEEIEAIIKQTISDFHESAYLTNAPLIFMTGAIEDAHLETLGKILVEPKTLKPENKTSISKQEAFFNLPSNPIIIDGANHLQSAIKFGKQVVGPESPDYYKMVLLNECIGGYFGSRLMRNLREDKGYTYGIHSYIQVREHSHVHMISTEVKAETSSSAIEEISKELSIMCRDLIPNDELESIKNSLLGKFASERATIFDAMETIKFRVLHNLPSNYYQNLVKELLKIESIDLLNYAKSSMNPSEYIIAQSV